MSTYTFKFNVCAVRIVSNYGNAYSFGKHLVDEKSTIQFEVGVYLI